MVVVGLTGGIGTGKSTVSEMLARYGAVVCDADRIAREVVEAGTQGFDEVVDAFGEDVVGPDGSLDRQALARIVFNEPEKRKTLESIIHPRVGLEIARTIDEERDTDHVVVLDVPLLLEAPEGSARLTDLVVVVAASESEQLERLAAKGMDRDDAEARIAAQMPMAEKIERADRVIHNDGSLEELERQVAELWEELSERAKGAS